MSWQLSNVALRLITRLWLSPFQMFSHNMTKACVRVDICGPVHNLQVLRWKPALVKHADNHGLIGLELHSDHFVLASAVKLE